MTDAAELTSRAAFLKVVASCFQSRWGVGTKRFFDQWILLDYPASVFVNFQHKTVKSCAELAEMTMILLLGIAE